MITMNVYINEDDTRVSLVYPDHENLTITFTRDELDRYIEILKDIRSRMQPAPGEKRLN